MEMILCHRCLHQLQSTQRWRVSDAGYKVHANLDECKTEGRAEREARLQGRVYSRNSFPGGQRHGR